MAPRWAGEGALVAALLLLLAVAVVHPLLQILAVAALDGGRPTLGPILAALGRPLLREALANTLLAGVLAVAIGSAIAVPLAMLSARWRFPGRALIGALAVPPLAIPPFDGAGEPTPGEAQTSTWLMLVVVYAVRLLPYTVRGARAALGSLPPALEEAARTLGAGGARSLRRILLPLMARGLLAGGLLALVASAVNLSSTLLLVPRGERGPLSSAFYREVQSADGRGPAAALGVVAIGLVVAGGGVATVLSRRAAAAWYRS